MSVASQLRLAIGVLILLLAGILAVALYVPAQIYESANEKYVIRDFHPLVFFYFLGFLFTAIGLVLGVVEVILRLKGNAITTPTIVLVALLLISGSQFTLFAMWFDMESNKDLGGRGRRRTDDPG